MAFPTETVYGLGAHAGDAAAVRRLFRAKDRPADNPLIVHLAEAGLLASVAGTVTPLARGLAERWWPGPLTLVLAAGAGLPAVTTGGLGTVAVRVPDHRVALALLRAAAVPVAAPSANRSGRPSPTTARHVLAEMGRGVDVVVDGGPCPVGVESTVVDARGDVPVVLREGAVTREQLGVAEVAPAAADREASPGTRYRHYAPACRVEVAAAGEGAVHAGGLRDAGLTVGLAGSGPAPGGVRELGRFSDAAGLARILYGVLRDGEETGVDVIVVEAVEEAGIGRAVMDRLRRAATSPGA